MDGWVSGWVERTSSTMIIKSTKALMTPNASPRLCPETSSGTSDQSAAQAIA